jgi:hypothetical protein
MADLEGSHRVHIAAPRDVCVELLLDAPRYPRWYDTLDRVEVLEEDDAGRPALVSVAADAGPLGVIEFVLRQSFELPGVIAGVQVDGGGRVVGVTNRWTLAAAPGDTTTATYSFAASASGFASKAILRAARPLAERDLIRDFPESLKREAEQRLHG